VKLGEGITAEDVSFERQGNDMEMFIKSTQDQKVTFLNWYNSLNEETPVVGKIILSNDIDIMIAGEYNKIIQAMASFAPQSMGTTSLSPDANQNLQVPLAVDPTLTNNT